MRPCSSRLQTSCTRAGSCPLLPRSPRPPADGRSRRRGRGSCWSERTTKAGGVVVTPAPPRDLSASDPAVCDERRCQVSKGREEGCCRIHAHRWGEDGMCGFPDALCGLLLLGRQSTSSSEGNRGRQADAIAQCWAQKRAEHRHILDLIEAGTFTVGGRQVLDAETLDEVRQWAAQRVATCEARIAARDGYP